MNVAELKAVLDNYGDHVPVAIVIEQGATDQLVTDFEVDSSNVNDVHTVTLTVSE